MITSLDRETFSDHNIGRKYTSRKNNLIELMGRNRIPGCKIDWNFQETIQLYRVSIWMSVSLSPRFICQVLWASLVAQMVKRLPAMGETQVWSLGWEIPWRRKWQPTPELLPEKFHGQRSLVGYGPWGHKESDTTERLHTHTLMLHTCCGWLCKTWVWVEVRERGPQGSEMVRFWLHSSLGCAMKTVEYSPIRSQN